VPEPEQQKPGEKVEGQKGWKDLPLIAKIGVVGSIIVLIFLVVSVFVNFNSAANALSVNRGHTNIVYVYLPAGNEAMLSLEAVCGEPFHSVVGGQVSYQDFSAPIIYVVGGGCADNEVIQTLVYKNATTTVHIIDLDQALKPGVTASG